MYQRLEFGAIAKTCENNKVHLITKKWTFLLDQWGSKVIRVKFPRKACRECQFRHLCTRSNKEARELTLRHKEEHLAIDRRRKRQETKTWLNTYNQRAGVEETISQAVRGFDMRSARYMGLDKVHLQHILTATAW
ncbi:transposase [Pleurocapsa sp. FMAR1]|uniref:transposase n=1 Tax=Pleurocapsa sp. FMAR1 TaxID=3040204 RepID=UPI0029C8ECBC|nr:transposase [Pleurocapsa sp. FMAR1]